VAWSEPQAAAPWLETNTLLDRAEALTAQADPQARALGLA
jgi:hypothetical protein